MAPKKYLFCTKNKEKKKLTSHVVPLDACFLISSRSQMFFKIDVLENFAKIQKNICAGLKKEISIKNSNFIEHLRVIAS